MNSNKEEKIRESRREYNRSINLDNLMLETIKFLLKGVIRERFIASIKVDMTIKRMNSIKGSKDIAAMIEVTTSILMGSILGEKVHLQDLEALLHLLANIVEVDIKDHYIESHKIEKDHLDIQAINIKMKDKMEEYIKTETKRINTMKGKNRIIQLMIKKKNSAQSIVVVDMKLTEVVTRKKKSITQKKLNIKIHTIKIELDFKDINVVKGINYLLDHLKNTSDRKMKELYLENNQDKNMFRINIVVIRVKNTKTKDIEIVEKFIQINIISQETLEDMEQIHTKNNILRNIMTKEVPIANRVKEDTEIMIIPEKIIHVTTEVKS